MQKTRGGCPLRRVEERSTQPARYGSCGSVILAFAPAGDKPGLEPPLYAIGVRSMRSLLMVAAVSVFLAFPAGARADCLKEVEALEQRLSSPPQPDRADKTGAETGIKVKERGGTTKYPEGGAAQPAESWLGSPPQQGQQVEEGLTTARRFADQGDEASCRRELEKAKGLSGKK